MLRLNDARSTGVPLQMSLVCVLSEHVNQDGAILGMKSCETESDGRGRWDVYLVYVRLCTTTMNESGGTERKRECGMLQIPKNHANSLPNVARMEREKEQVSKLILEMKMA